MTIRDSLLSTLPPWLAERVAYRLQWSVALALDADWALLEEGIKARMPGVGTEDALADIGNDRKIDRGPSEGAESYAARLSAAFDTWRNAGSPYALLEQLRAVFLPSPPPIRVVSDSSVWHEIDPTTGIVTRTKPAVPNWVWDTDSPTESVTPHWWRGWIIIDASALGRWGAWEIGDEHEIGELDLLIGTTMTSRELTTLQRVSRRWKPAHVWNANIIVTFDPTLFLPTNAPGVNMPDGTWGNPDNRNANALYLEGSI